MDSKVRALARLLESYTDLNSAKSLLQDKIESRSLYHSQQCVEKALKACISVKYLGEIKTHLVVNIFKREIYPLMQKNLQAQFDKLTDKVLWIEERWVNTRYEEYDVERGRIKIPTLIFGVEDAKEGIRVAEKILTLTIEFLSAYFQLKIPTRYEELKKLVVKGEQSEG